jgi:ribosomal protein S18 acetylase RimI-like enzyme
MDAVVLSTDIEAVDWLRLVEVFERAPLGRRDPAQLELSFRNSQVRCFVYVAGELVGAGRALSDRVMWTVIYDVALLPECQGRGLGRAIMDSLIDQAQAASVMLHSAPGKEPFYANLGFRLMKTAMARFADPARAQARGFID